MPPEPKAPPAQDTPKTGDDRQAPNTDPKPPAAPTKEPDEPKTNDGGKGDGNKVEDDGKPNQDKVVPEKYDLKLPEGSMLGAAQMEKTATYSKERGFSNEEAQALLEHESAIMSEFVEGKAEEWLSGAKADKELGGEAFEKNAELSKRVVDRFGTDAFRKTLNETGLGNHPELLRVFVRIGKAMAEDGIEKPGTPPSPVKSLEEVFYGKKS